MSHVKCAKSEEGGWERPHEWKVLYFVVARHLYCTHAFNLYKRLLCIVSIAVRPRGRGWADIQLHLSMLP